MSAFLHRFGEVRPFLYAVAADVADGEAEPVNFLQGVDGVEEIQQVVSIGHIGAALNPVESMLNQRALDIVVSAVVLLAVVFLEVGDIHIETQCVHGLQGGFEEVCFFEVDLSVGSLGRDDHAHERVCLNVNHRALSPVALVRHLRRNQYVVS